MLPKALKNFNLFIDGASFLGVISEVTLPKLTRKVEAYRGAGMNGEAEIDLGQEAIELSYKAGGVLTEVLKQYGATEADAVQHRWVGAYQDDSAGKYTKVEVVTRGRHKEIDQGSAKAGEIGEQSMTVTCTYYKLSVDNKDVIEIDMLAGGVFIVDGVDRNAELRDILGI
ncbi:hypothetical protein MMA231_02496 [Asticcacaulis sp. MM231]|uniref:phage major tail tube protein n=1 Tax=Asticcacaulis sp. MM231 TaxID=3157666 RepID=UPI0032D5AE7E